jgi:aspartate racemase
MKSIGLIGGMSWHATLTYYRLINERVQRKLGGIASAEITIRSLNLAEMQPLATAERWDEVTAILVDHARVLERAGVDVIAIASNTPHMVAGEVSAAIDTPLLHIADAAGDRLSSDKQRTVALVGTRFVMDNAFYADRLRDQYGLEVLRPDEHGRDAIHTLIFDELCRGRTGESTRAKLLVELRKLRERGADAILLACTDFSTLFESGDCGLPLYDTTAIHAEALAMIAVETA